MKKFKLYSLFAATIAAGLVSCGDDFLTEEPASSLPIEGYYTTNARIMESAVAAYDPMQWYDYFGGWAPLNLTWDCMGDDVYVGGGSPTGDQPQLHKISWYKSDPNDNIGGFWSANYSGINRSIRLIDNATASSLSDTDKNLYVAEGRVMRAWYYLCLWKTWGNIPLYMENLTFPYIAEQKTADEVYETVIADLEDVIDSNVLPMKQPDEWAGRVTQAAASMIYTDYVMYQKDKSRYSKALGYMKAIISSGKYGLVANYEDLYLIDKEWNEEIIWDINFIAKGGKRGWGSANATGGTVLPEMIGIDGLSLKGDLKGTKSGPLTEFQGGWGFAPISKEVYEAFEENDLRRDVAILSIDKYIKDMAEVGITVTYGGRYQNTGFFLRKYLPIPGGTEGNAGDGSLNWDNNLHLYRYAETLLNAAELGMELGDANAATYFNEVRNRAGLSPIPLNLENIIAERRLEFVGEGKRYFDLVRSGFASQFLKAGGGAALNAEKTAYTEKGIPGRTEGWTEKKKYITIPQSEIEASQGTIKQNDI